MGLTGAANPSLLLSRHLRNSTPTTFPHFPLLPPELQVMIFEYAADVSRSICLQSGILRNGLLAACYMSRSVVGSRIVTHEGSAWERFKVSFHQTLDYLDVTALFRPKLLSKSWIMGLPLDPQLAYHGDWQNHDRTMVRDRLRTMAWFNARCCSVLEHLSWTELGRNFMGGVKKLRMDIKTISAPPDVYQAETNDWRDLWELILDNFGGVMEIEMRIIDEQIIADRFGEQKKTNIDDLSVDVISIWEWNREYARYDAVSNTDDRRRELPGNSRIHEEDTDEEEISSQNGDGAPSDNLNYVNPDVRAVTQAVLDGAEEAEDLVRSDLDGDDVEDDGTIWTLSMPRIIFTKVRR